MKEIKAEVNSKECRCKTEDEWNVLGSGDKPVCR